MLESRVLLSGSTSEHLDPPSAAGAWQAQGLTVEPGRWIAQIGGLTGSPPAQLQSAQRQLSDITSDLHVTRHLGTDGLFLIDAPAGTSQRQLRSTLRQLGPVQRLEPDFAIQSDAIQSVDPYTPSLWGLNNTGQSGGKADADIDAPEAWSIAQPKDRVVVGVIDTGVDYTHPDLAANMWRNPGEVPGNGIDDDRNGYADDVYGWDFASDDNNPMDENSHGTHVAGTIAAVGNNAKGIVGVDPDARLMALRFLDATGSGSTSDAVAAINYATQMRTRYGVNVRVLNASWGGGSYSSALQEAIRNAAHAGILFVAAAGNGGYDGVGDNNDAIPTYPANYIGKNVISVAATDSADALASFSNYGSATVDLAAPGVNILSTVPGNGYSSYSGTSMATPHVAGAAALAFSAKPDASYQHIRRVLLQGADPVSDLAGLTASGGRLNAHGTLQLLTASDTSAHKKGNAAKRKGKLAVNDRSAGPSGPDAQSGSIQRPTPSKKSASGAFVYTGASSLHANKATQRSSNAPRSPFSTQRIQPKPFVMPASMPSQGPAGISAPVAA